MDRIDNFEQTSNIRNILLTLSNINNMWSFLLLLALMTRHVHIWCIIIGVCSLAERTRSSLLRGCANIHNLECNTSASLSNIRNANVSPRSATEHMNGLLPTLSWVGISKRKILKLSATPAKIRSERNNASPALCSRIKDQGSNGRLKTL